MKDSELQKHFQTLAEKWPSSFVARKNISEFTGGIISPGRIANLDCLGEGPPVRIRVGRQICYPVEPFIRWFVSRAEVVKKRR